jgi:hypothetical protein
MVTAVSPRGEPGGLGGCSIGRKSPSDALGADAAMMFH